MELPEVHVVSGVPFVLRFDHRFHFEGDDEALWDGGVIEYSTDAGGTWRDVGWWQLALQPRRPPDGPPLPFDPAWVGAPDVG